MSYHSAAFCKGNDYPTEAGGRRPRSLPICLLNFKVVVTNNGGNNSPSKEIEKTTTFF
jgi:hypothetical protein